MLDSIGDGPTQSAQLSRDELPANAARGEDSWELTVLAVHGHREADGTG